MIDKEKIRKLFNEMPVNSIEKDEKIELSHCFNTNTTNYNNCGFKLLYLTLFQLSVFIFLLFFIIYILVVREVSEDKEGFYLNHSISATQQEDLRRLFRLVAVCEKKHINTIHSEIKREFLYYSYKFVDEKTYVKIMNNLSKRVCKIEK